MKRKIPLTEEERYYRDSKIKFTYKETTFSLSQIGRIYNISKQLVSVIVKKK